MKRARAIAERMGHSIPIRRRMTKKKHSKGITNFEKQEVSKNDFGSDLEPRKKI